MSRLPSEKQARGDDERLLEEAGYRQELVRGMGPFTNFAISMSTICILAGGLTSFHVGLCSVGGASIGIGWPVGCLFSLVVAVTMAQVASAFPTAGGPYHWASVLGGKDWGWVTACFNLAGLVTVLAAINVGTWRFVVGALGPYLGFDPAELPQYVQPLAVVLMTASQAIVNHFSIRWTNRLTDLSGYLIMVGALVLTVTLVGLAAAQHGLHVERLVTFTNYSGSRGNDVWEPTESIGWLFALGLLLPAYTVTGFDASAHTAEETLGAAHNVPRGIIRSVWVSGLAGWFMVVAILLAIPDMDAAAAKGEGSFFHILGAVVPTGWAMLLYAAIIPAQYLCGLATLTSGSRMTYAFARDGGLPLSRVLRRVSPTWRSPSAAIWSVSVVAAAFVVFLPYETIAAICVVFLYISYAVPTALGLRAHGRAWTRMGPWHLGRWYRPLAALCVFGCLVLIVIGMWPPNDIAVWVVGGSAVILAMLWFVYLRHHFAGPPHAILHLLRQTEATSPHVGQAVPDESSSKRCPSGTA
jgi:amino acid transporter